MAKDAIGQELNIGDTVISPRGVTDRVSKVTIVKFDKIMVDLSNGTKRYPNVLVRVPTDGGVIVSKGYLSRIEKDAEHLSQLEALGVDNWEGYQGYRPDGFCEECMNDVCDCEVTNE